MEYNDAMNTRLFQPPYRRLAGGMIALLGLLASCGSGVATEDQLVDAYLTALQTGDVATAQSLYCIPSAYPDAVSTFNSHTIVMMEPDISVPNQPTLSRTVLQVSLTGSADDSERLHMEVWDTNDLYLAIQAQNREWRSVGGTPIVEQPRAEWRDEPLCVFQPSAHDPYPQVEIGMSLEEVREILRSPGEVEETSGRVQVIRWTVPSGQYYAYAEVVNNRVQATWLRYYN